MRFLILFLLFPFSPAFGNNTASLIEGLLAEPRSAERRKAAKIVETELLRHFPPSPSPDQQALQNVIKMTAEYLRGNHVCQPSQRITVYRGTGPQPLVRKSPARFTSSKKLSDLEVAPQGFLTITQLMSRWRTLVTTLESPTSEARWDGHSWDEAHRAPVLTGYDPGTAIYRNRAKLSAVEGFDRFPWSYFLGFGRKIPSIASHEPSANHEKTQEFVGQDINGGLARLAIAHTFNSVNSPLISVTTSAEVARDWAPGFASLSVCPERLVLLQHDLFFGEREAFIPFFVLPEEIKTYLGWRCGWADSFLSEDHPDIDSCRRRIKHDSILQPPSQGFFDDTLPKCFHEGRRRYIDEQKVSDEEFFQALVQGYNKDLQSLPRSDLASHWREALRARLLSCE